jgi:arsenical pump membrane protein
MQRPGPAQVEPLPYLFICVFIANAASFALPITNPANLVVFGGQMPALSEWLHYFAGPSFVAILATYVVLRLTQRRALEAKVTGIKGAPPLTFGGKLAAVGIALTGVVLLLASAFGWPLGLPTFCARRIFDRLRAGHRAPIAAAHTRERFVECTAPCCGVCSFLSRE